VGEQGGRGLRRNYVLWIGTNVVFVMFHPWWIGSFTLLPEIARSIAISLILFVLPAIGWVALLGPQPRALGMRLARHLIVSTVVFFVWLGIRAGAGLELTPVLAWNLSWLLTNVGFIAARMLGVYTPQRRALLPQEAAIGAVCFLAAYGLYFWAATRVVPPQQDQDLEVVGTGYGLLTRLEPLLLTDRQSVYFFAHPPLLHLYVAGSYLLDDGVADLRFYYDSSARVRDAWEGRPVVPPVEPFQLAGRPKELPVPPGMYRVVAVSGLDYHLSSGTGPPVAVSIESVELDRIYSHYQIRPLLVASRTPNIFFAAATVALLAIWAGRISHRRWLGVLVATAYASSPEVVVRSSYGGYFSVGALACILMLLANERWRWSSRRGRFWLPGMIGVFAALVDHKLIVLPAALGLIAIFGRGNRPLARLHPVAVGFAVGTLSFWMWGLATAPGPFIDDHLRGHLIDRLTHHNPFDYGGYPTPTGLWAEFNAHTGYVLLPAGLFLIAWGLWRTRRAPASRTNPSLGPWLLWIALTAGAFTIVDWRMTKHLILLALPLCLGLVPGRVAARWRVALPVVAGILLVLLNAVSIAGLARDFQSFTVTPAW
jgi:hypothetical protein